MVATNEVNAAMGIIRSKRKITCYRRKNSNIFSSVAGTVAMAEGTPAECTTAFSIALKNLLGLVCDPVAGLVEVPCVKRKCWGPSNALIVADRALHLLFHAMKLLAQCIKLAVQCLLLYVKQQKET